MKGFDVLELTESHMALGTVIVIDVLRAFTTSALILNNGAKRIFLLKEIMIAYNTKHNQPDTILVGEKGGKLIKGFDYDNSPFAIKDIKFKHKDNIILRTSSGTRGVIQVIKNPNVKEVVVGSFLNRTALKKYIENKDHISFMITGSRTPDGGAEDMALAHYLIGRMDFETACRETWNCFSTLNWIKNKRDVEISLSYDFNFIQKVEKTGSTNYVKLIKEVI